jgi:hypothetical protein
MSKPEKNPERGTPEQSSSPAAGAEALKRAEYKKWREEFFRAHRDVPAARLHEIRSMIVTRPVERDPDSQTPKDS